jgi:hypothetical protein
MLGRSKDVNAYASRVQLLAAKLDRTERYAGTVAGLRARAKLLEGKPAEALALLESTRNKIWFGWAVGSPGDSQVADRYLRAQLLEQAGRREEARRWYQSITQFSANDLLYAWPAQMALNRIARS